MRKHLFLFSFVLSSIYVNAQTTVNGSFMHGGQTRTYSFYVPASYVQGQAVPLVLNLHGLTSNGAQQSIYGDFKPIADTANFIVVHPNGTTMLGQQHWNIGNVGSSADDIGFLEALIDTISAQYSINPKRVYCTGMSNGGYMSFYMACQTNRFAAVGSVTGSMTVPMYNACNPARPTPTITIHGTSDATVPYAGSSTSKSIEDVVDFWVNENACNTTPAITQIPNTNTTDNATAERYLYTGGHGGNTVEFFKVTGGGHTWPGTSVIIPAYGNTCLDFSASKEIWRFFSQHQHTTASIENSQNSVKLNIWPNPTQGILNIQTENKIVTNVTVIDMQGRIMTTITKEGIESIDLSNLKSGNYVAKISGKDFTVVKKIMVATTH